ncbi:MAG: nucleotide exchange factor GrpE [Gemmatimonadota bacterium]
MKERSEENDDQLATDVDQAEGSSGGRDGSGNGGASDEGGALPEEGALAELRSEFDELNDRHLRLAAEFNNFRRRSEQERRESWSRAQADLLGRLLDVLDDLERVAALDTSSATVDGIMEGIDLVERKFIRALGETGAEIIDPAEQPFDPERMEALMRVATEDEELDDHVAQVFQKGYELKGVLVRPARVSVYKHG